LVNDVLASLGGTRQIDFPKLSLAAATKFHRSVECVVEFARGNRRRKTWRVARMKSILGIERVVPRIGWGTMGGDREDSPLNLFIWSHTSVWSEYKRRTFRIASAILRYTFGN